MVVLTEEKEGTMAIEVGVEEDSMVVVEVHTNSTLLSLNRITIQHRPLNLGVKPSRMKDLPAKFVEKQVT